MLSRLPTGNFRPRALYFLSFLVLVAGGDAEVIVAGRQVDFLVGARLLVLVGHQLLGGQILVASLTFSGAATSNGSGCFDFSTGSGSQALPQLMQVTGSSLARS